jgi:hypothetical protein
MILKYFLPLLGFQIIHILELILYWREVINSMSKEK